jgi:hypothetical protein
VKFLLKGKIRLMDELSDRTHISPIFWDLFLRQYLPRAGLELVEHFLYPPNGYSNTRRLYTWGLHPLGLLLSGDSLQGDVHVVALRLQK